MQQKEYPFLGTRIIVCEDGRVMTRGGSPRFESEVKNISGVRVLDGRNRKFRTLELDFDENGRKSTVRTECRVKVRRRSDGDLINGIVDYFRIVLKLKRENRIDEIPEVPVYWIEKYEFVMHEATDRMRANAAFEICLYPDRITFQNGLKVLDTIMYEDITYIEPERRGVAVSYETEEVMEFYDRDSNYIPIPHSFEDFLYPLEEEIVVEKRKKTPAKVHVYYEREGDEYRNTLTAGADSRMEEMVKTLEHFLDELDSYNKYYAKKG